MALPFVGSALVVMAASLPVVAAPAITLVSSFTGPNGIYPMAQLTAAGGGIYYGTTYQGGAGAGINGSVFEFNSSTGSITLKDSFTGANGSGPSAALTAAGGGLYYGTTRYGGNNGQGGVFEFNSGTGSITLKNSFMGSNGANPVGALTAAGGGIYYGTAYQGGGSNRGGVFEFNSNTSSITLKASFTLANGAYPLAPLTAAGGGLYYGSTLWGAGGNANGAVFEFNSNTGLITLKDSFTGVDGTSVYAGLTAAVGGLFYGTTNSGGANGKGGIFEFNSVTGLITLKGSFTGVNGMYPFGPLTEAGDNLYYGAITRGGPNGKGGVYEFNSYTGLITLISSFTDTINNQPFAALTAAGGGQYFIATESGGPAGLGAIYSFSAGTPQSVPAPLPLIGTGVAFGYCRRLRWRVRQAQPRQRLASGHGSGHPQL
jgi:uncharacterized repeat protein (TIGR03803 family)